MKWVEAFPLQRVDSETLATILVDEIVCRYGVPTHLHSDQGANLCSQIIDKICSILGISRTRMSAYHPQGNGQVERFNRTLKDMLAKSIQENQRNWDVELQKALFAYRVSINESTGFSPFLANFGRSPQLPVDAMFHTGYHSTYDRDAINLPQFVRQVQSTIRRCTVQIRENLTRSREKRQKGGVIGDDLQVGDRVYLHVQAIQKGTIWKLASLWRGPYTVIDRLRPVNYQIQLIGNKYKVLVKHRNRLKLCFENPVSNVDTQADKPVDLPRYVHNDNHDEPVAGFTTMGRPNVSTSTNQQQPTPPLTCSPRPTRNRRPPDRYVPFVTS